MSDSDLWRFDWSGQLELERLRDLHARGLTVFACSTCGVEMHLPADVAERLAAPPVHRCSGAGGMVPLRRLPGPTPDLRSARRPGLLHNVVAHPLLVLWPRVGRWLHDCITP